MDEALIGLGVTAAGSLINFLATKVYNFATGSSKNFLWKEDEESLRDFQTSESFDELKRRARIVVIDDENSFPVRLFQDEGYSIDKWDSVKDYSKLENGHFDIIVLDIKGVAQHISEDDGLGVLTNLKNYNPAQIIISYSQHSYDLNKVQFFQRADENIAKPSDYLKIKGIIDNLITSKFKPERYINALTELLRKNNVDNPNAKKLNSDLAKAIKNQRMPNWDKTLEFLKSRPDLFKQIKGLGETILKFYR
jgi:hypothetical protein